MQFQKPFLTIDEQVELLLKRGLMISSKSECAAWLKTHNYYRLRAYWLPFETEHPKLAAEPETQNHYFLPDSTFEQVIALYEMDERLRPVVFSGLQKFELAFRASLSYAHAKHHGAHGYLNREIFQSKPADKGTREQWHAKFISDLLKDCSKSKEVFIDHYFKKYTSPLLPPIWASIEIVTFGSLSFFYKYASKEVRIEVASSFDLPAQLLENYLRHFSVIRNICAHHGRLWNRIITFTPILPAKRFESTNYFDAFNRNTIPNPSVDKSPQAFIYNSILILSYLLKNAKSRACWKSDIFQVMKDVTEKSVPILPDNFNLEGRMGFPKGWREFQYWNS